jgi:hypothetical protein
MGLKIVQLSVWSKSAFKYLKQETGQGSVNHYKLIERAEISNDWISMRKP